MGVNGDWIGQQVNLLRIGFSEETNVYMKHFNNYKMLLKSGLNNLHNKVDKFRVLEC